MVALKKFMSFIIKDKRHQKFTTEEDKSWAVTILADLPNWSKSYKKQIGIESAKEKLKQLDVLLDANKINKYKASEEYRSAVKILGRVPARGWNIHRST